jgi:hypothetical protein
MDMLQNLVRKAILWYLRRAGGALKIDEGKESRYVIVVDGDAYRFLKNIDQNPPWEGAPNYRWDDPVWVPESLREEAKSAPWLPR